jgi:hypothetical protein
MNNIRMVPMVLALTLAAAGGSGFAQNESVNTAPVAASTPLTRAAVKMDAAEFRRTHRWDVTAENWVLKADFEPPHGVKSRAEVKAETVQFLRLNRWDEATGNWIPLKAKPRETSTMTRAQVRAETIAIVRTHDFDDVTGTWVAKPMARSKAEGK